MAERKSRYTPTPAVPAQLMPRLAAIIDVLAGLTTVSAAAHSLGLSRNHFQTILHRAVQGTISAISAKPGGRPAAPSAVRSLQAQLVRLKRENARLQRRVESTDRLLEVASGLLHGRMRPTGRQRRTRKAAGSTGDRHDSSDPEARRQQVLDAVDEMRRLGLTVRVAAALSGVHPATLRRWRARAGASTAASSTVRLHVEPSAAAVVRAAQLVRRLHGLIGAEALRRSVEGLSRRAAARIKAHTLTDMERERKASLVQVTVTQPGVLRGLDEMYFASTRGRQYALIMADGAVPYRTSFAVSSCEDSEFVARALRRDLERHGAPLVVRLDRASIHDTCVVREVLKAHGVLTLHGPASYPCFYGQLERQNREHRAWVALLPCDACDRLEACLTQMMEAVNELWPRCKLNWQTAAAVWSARPPLNVDRHALREEVHERAMRIAQSFKRRGQPADLAERLAIERTLEQKGYLRQEIGGWC